VDRTGACSIALHAHDLPAGRLAPCWDHEAGHEGAGVTLLRLIVLDRHGSPDDVTAEEQLLSLEDRRGFSD